MFPFVMVCFDPETKQKIVSIFLCAFFCVFISCFFCCRNNFTIQNDDRRTMDKLRFNSIGIQMIPELLHKKLYGITGNRSAAAAKVKNNSVNINHILSQLKKSIDGLQIKQTTATTNQADFPWQTIVKYLPPLKNDNIIDHIDALGKKYSSPYLKCAFDLMKISDSLLQNTPTTWAFQSGWTRYTRDMDGNFTAESVPYPGEDAIVFDVEVCLDERNNNRPTLAVALTPAGWYSWCGEPLIDLANETPNNDAQATSTSSQAFDFIDEATLDSLIPIGTAPRRERLIVGHNVSFDRSFIKEQYEIEQDRTRFLDTMSLHICVAGLNQDQKMFAIRNGNPWNAVSSLNNLNDVYKLHCGSERGLDKDPRDIFVKGTMRDVLANYQHLTSYCANDVAATLRVLRSIFGTFVQRFPNPVTLVGMLEMSIMYLPVNVRTWKRYLHESQSIYDECKEEINQTLREIACDTCSYQEDERYRRDAWLWDLDWSTRDIGFKKSFQIEQEKKLLGGKISSKRKQKSGADAPVVSSPVIQTSLIDSLLDTAKHLRKNLPTMPGYPKWFCEFCENSSKHLRQPERIDLEVLLETNQLNISPKLRAIPKLLKMMWNGFPLHHDKTHGWGYLVPDPAQDSADLRQFLPLEHIRSLVENNDEEMQRLKREDGIADIVPGCLFYRLPHKDGPSKRVGNPLGKDFIAKISDGTLRPFNSAVKDIVLQQNAISYWVNSSKRILSQMVVPYDPIRGDGSILPRVVVSGTVTRRAVEPTWLTASNSYADRLGSELKAIIQCPRGYCYVGADVDSQELWIAALLGDAHYCGIQGSTGLGWMTLRGDRSAGTDMHSVTAKSINISRDDAKVLNYARIYGSGPDFAARFLRQSNPRLSEEEAKRKAKKIFIETKGVKKQKSYHYYQEDDNDNDDDQHQIVPVRRQWSSGTESHMFNKLEEIATSAMPRTPFLRCRISRALEPSIIGNDYMTSRINWVVQSSAVDFLHILLVCMKWLMERFEIDGRFSISIHDEIRFIIRDRDRYRAAYALQLANLMTRAYFTASLKLNDLPASVAFFSSIEIDRCLRKNVSHDCKTPSNPLGLAKGYGVPAGESLTIESLMRRIELEFERQTETKTSELKC